MVDSLMKYFDKSIVGGHSLLGGAVAGGRVCWLHGCFSLPASLYLHGGFSPGDGWPLYLSPHH